MTNYAGTAIVRILSQIKYSQLDFSDDTEYNNFLNGTLIPKACKIIDTFCNHNFNHNYGTMTLDGTGKKTVIIPPQYCPLITVTSATLNSTDITSSIKTYDTYIVYDGGIFTKDEQNLTVKGTYGYSSVPEDIQYVTAELCAGALRHMVRSKMMPDMIAPTLEEGSGRLFGAIMASPKVFTSEVKDMLTKYCYYQVSVG